MSFVRKGKPQLHKGGVAMRKRITFCILVATLAFGMAGHSFAQNYQIVSGYYYAEAGVQYSDTTYRIFNTSFVKDIVLGPVYLMEVDGILGDSTVYEGLVGTSVPPLGTAAFDLSQTEAPPSGTRVVIITWTGPVATTKIEGAKVFYDGYGNSVAVHDIKLLGPARANLKPWGR
jgi:hypothetical protein